MAPALSARARDPLPANDRSFQYRPDLDGLRGIGVWVVLLFHVGWTHAFQGAPASLDLFFVLSGYLITQVILRDLETGKFTFVRFYERRARRLFPALCAVMAFATAVALAVLPAPALRTYGASLAATAAYLSNYHAWARTGPAGTSALLPLAQTWSLGVEEQFYILFPPLLIVLLRRGRTFAFWSLGVAAVVLLAVALWNTAELRSYFLTTSRAWELLLGCLLALNVFPRITSRPLLEAMAVTGILLYFFSVRYFPIWTPLQAYYVVPACAATAMLIYANEERMTWVGRQLGRQPLRFFGIISYSIYLWHWPLVVLASAFWVWPHFPIAVRLALVGISVVAGILSWRFLEQPFRRPNGVVGRRTLFIGSGAILLLFVGIGLAIRLA